MLHRIGDKEFCRIVISLFINEKEYGIGVTGLEKILIEETTTRKRNPNYRGIQDVLEYPEFIETFNKKHEYKLWVLEIIKGGLSHRSIIENLSKISDKYNCYSVYKNDNSSVTTRLKSKLKARFGEIKLGLYDVEFNPENSVVHLKGLLNDREIYFFDNVKETFENQILAYDLVDNPIASHNALMLALDHTYEPPRQKYGTKIVIWNMNR